MELSLSLSLSEGAYQRRDMPFFEKVLVFIFLSRCASLSSLGEDSSPLELSVSLYLQSCKCSYNNDYDSQFSMQGIVDRHTNALSLPRPRAPPGF